MTGKQGSDQSGAAVKGRGRALCQEKEGCVERLWTQPPSSEARANPN